MSATAQITFAANFTAALPPGVVFDGVQHGPGLTLLQLTDRDPARPSFGATFYVDVAATLEREIGRVHDAKRIAFGERPPLSETAPHCAGENDPRP